MSNGGYKFTKKLILASPHGTHAKEPTFNPANFTVNFANSDFAHGNIGGMVLVDAVIPNLFYNVNADSRRVRINNGFIFYDIDMPLGQYSATQYMDELTLQVAATTAGSLNITSYAIDPVTGFLSVVFDSGSAVFGGSAMTLQGRRLLGLNPEDAFGDPQFISPVDFSGVHTVLVHSDVMQANATLGADNKHHTIVDFISLAETPWGFNSHHHIWDQGVRHHDFFSNTSLQSMHIWLTDVHNTPLVLPHNVEVTMNFNVFLRND